MRLYLVSIALAAAASGTIVGVCVLHGPGSGTVPNIIFQLK